MSNILIDVICKNCNKITRDIFIERKIGTELPNLVGVPCQQCGITNSLKREWSQNNIHIDKESVFPKDHIYNVEIEHRDSYGKKINTKLPRAEIDKFNKGK